MRQTQIRLFAAVLACTSLFGFGGSAHATNRTSTGYVCSISLAPNGVDPNGGTYGYLYVSINTQPGCAGTPLQDGYVYSLNASYAGSEWQPAWRYSDAALNSIYQTLVEAAHGLKKVRLSGSDQAPHHQITSVMVYGSN
jgi:hypothetical protein